MSSGVDIYLIKVSVVQAEELFCTGGHTEPDPFVEVRITGGPSPIEDVFPEFARTSVVEMNRNPHWDEFFYFLATDMCDHLQVLVLDSEHSSRAESLGELLVDFADIEDKGYKMFPLKTRFGGGRIIIGLERKMVKQAGYKPFKLWDKELLPSNMERISLATLALPNPERLIYIHLYSGEDLKAADRKSNSSDPYAVISFLNERGKILDLGYKAGRGIGRKLISKVCERTISPDWDQGFLFMQKDSRAFRVTVRDKDSLSPDDHLGFVDIPIIFQEKEEHPLSSQGNLVVSVRVLPCRGLL